VKLPFAVILPLRCPLLRTTFAFPRETASARPKSDS
jgi:hypothetical protein